MSSRPVTYICVLVESKEAADRANEHLDTLTTDSFKIEALFKFQALKGLHHLGRRPTLILDHTVDDHPKYNEWYNWCVRSLGNRDTTLIKLTEELKRDG